MPKNNVAPRAGAWIETKRGRYYPKRSGVAPRAGAWIETIKVQLLNAPSFKSHPVRVRGLKL